MKIALERLGIEKCHHLLTPMFENIWTTRVRESATALATENTALRQSYLRKRFNGYDAVLDLPGSACVDDLIQMYPDAKVTLSLSRLHTISTDMLTRSSSHSAATPMSGSTLSLGWE